MPTIQLSKDCQPLNNDCQPLNSVKIANHSIQLNKDCQPLKINKQLPAINNAVQKFSQYNFQKTIDVKPPSEKLEDRKHEANLI